MPNFFTLYFSEDLKFWTFLIFRSIPTKSWKKPLPSTRRRNLSSSSFSCLHKLKSQNAASQSSSKRRADALKRTVGATDPDNKAVLLALGDLNVPSWSVACSSCCSAAARSLPSSWSSSALPHARSHASSAVIVATTLAPAAGLSPPLPLQHPFLLLSPSLITLATAPLRQWTLADLATPSLNKCWLTLKKWALMIETRTFVL